jgi:polyribonucleotide nucleotidyltransferase
MADAITVSSPISGSDRTMTLETGQLAWQADGAVVIKVGKTTVLVTATASRKVREGQDFFPLTVDVEERMYAAGKIPGSFFRREGRAGDQATLTARLTDRPLRPSFPDGFRNEVHVVALIMGADLENPHDVLVINAASAALMISGIPFDGPIGAVRLAYSTDGKWIPHPTYQEGDESTFELVVAGRALSDDPGAEIAIMMVEAGGTEHAWQFYEEGAPKVTEAVVAEGLEAAKTWIRESIELQRELVKAAGGKRPIIPFELFVDYAPEVAERVEAVGGSLIASANAIQTKTERNLALDEATDQIIAQLGDEFDGREREVRAAVRSITKKLVRRRIVEEGIRMDGRAPAELRKVTSAIGILPTAHGSGLFERGMTQVLNVTTLGMPRMNQLIDSLGVDSTKRYIHHYNFPPFSVGEPGRMMGPKRRDIGHGLLAERALLPVIPPADEFPYVLRLVSDILSSDGSTSMGSVCASTLSLMDAGVPIKAPVAGIAMGMIFAEGKYTALTDISGAEDAFGDMDFKVAGTRDFVTALQLDTKIDGLPADVLGQALQQAREARMQIMDIMAAAISEPAPDVKPYAPKIVAFEIPMDKIGEVIGPKGKVINAIQQETGADIAVDDDGMVGTVTIGAKESIVVEEARRRIELILDPPVAEVGAVYPGKVVNITKFGAFVNILPGRDGLLHISKLGAGKRIERVEDVLSLGQPVSVVVEDIDPQGKISLALVGDDGEPVGRKESSDGARSNDGDRPSESAPAPRPAAVSVSDEAAPVASEGGAVRRVSFEDSFASQLEAEFGDLGPADTAAAPREDRGPRRRGPRR